MIKPFLKWAGGKQSLTKVYSEYFPKEFNNYYEPFLGGGAVFLYLQPQNYSCLSDKCKELINVYNQIKDNIDNILYYLNKIKYEFEHSTNKERYYYDNRIMYLNKYLSNEYKAVLFLFLNKTCYNGLYRVNKYGKFNVPYGKCEKFNFDTSNMLGVSKILQKCIIKCCDFIDILEQASKNDFIYFDPPYYSLKIKNQNFTSYTKEEFSKYDHLRLFDLIIELDKKKCKIMLSNSNYEFIRELYRDFRIVEIDARRNIGRKTESRINVKDLLILNY